MALAKPDAFAALRVVTTVKNPSLANFCAIAPPTPHRTPTGSSLSSTWLPYSRLSSATYSGVSAITR